MSKLSRIVLTPSGEKVPSNPADLRPVVLRLVSDPLTAGRLEKLRIALLRQISRYGWRLMMTALEAACEHGARHQQANPQAVALWRCGAGGRRCWGNWPCRSRRSLHPMRLRRDATRKASHDESGF